MGMSALAAIFSNPFKSVCTYHKLILENKHHNETTKLAFLARKRQEENLPELNIFAIMRDIHMSICLHEIVHVKNRPSIMRLLCKSKNTNLQDKVFTRHTPN